LPDGTGLTHSSEPSVRRDQVSVDLGVKVWSKVLNSNVKPFSGCGFAGCSSGFRGTVESGILMANLDGSNERTITSGGYDTDPSFSPDGVTIVFLTHQQKSQYAEAYDSVALVHAGGGAPRLFDPPEKWSYASPVWSPDGTTIAVTRRRNDVPDESAGAAGVFLINVADGAVREVASGAYHELAWSHDGRRLATTRLRYQAFRGSTVWQPGMRDTGNDVWILSLDGGPPQNVTHLAPAVEAIVPGCGLFNPNRFNVEQPRWSNDDSQIAYLTNEDHRLEIRFVEDVAVVRTDGTQRHIVYRAPGQRCGGGLVTPGLQPTAEVVALLGWL
jgi:Tol biopolymer transport system component